MGRVGCLNGTEAQPVPGNIGVCNKCYEIMVYGPDMVLAKATAAHRRSLGRELLHRLLGLQKIKRK